MSSLDQPRDAESEARRLNWDEVPVDDEHRDDDDGQSRVVNVFRDGNVHVLSEMCSTCVFRPGNLMHLDRGRLKRLTDHVQETGVPFSCHQTLPYSHEQYEEHYGGQALCHGAVSNYGGDSPIIRLAEAMGVIVEVPAYPGDEETTDGD